MSVTRTSLRILQEMRWLPCWTQSTRGMAIDIDKFKDKETAEEVFDPNKGESVLGMVLGGFLQQTRRTIAQRAFKEDQKTS